MDIFWNSPLQFGYTALYLTASSGYIGLCKYFLNKCTDINMQIEVNFS